MGLLTDFSRARIATRYEHYQIGRDFRDRENAYEVAFFQQAPGNGTASITGATDDEYEGFVGHVAN